MRLVLSLLASRRFAPLFVTQFLGAFNDNLFKTALIFLATFHFYAGDAVAAVAFATLATGLFGLPYVLFSGLAGDIADVRDKAAIARWVKLAEIVFMVMGAAALMLPSPPLGLAVIFLMGVHSTVFGPIKYAILPQHLRQDELLLGTGLVEGATFVAILLGQISGGLLAATTAGPMAIGVAIAGYAASRSIPAALPVLRRAIDWNPATNSWRALCCAFGNRQLGLATVAISWFWAVGAVFTTQFAPLVKNDLGGSEGVATLFLASFSVGIAVGSAGIGRLLGGRVSNALTPWAALAMAAAGTDLFFALQAFSGPAGDVAGFLATAAGWRVLADLFLMAVAGGVFSVPLYGVLQTATDPGSRSRTIAANNIINFAFQVAAVLAIGLVITLGASIAAALLGVVLTALLIVPVVRRLPR